MNQENQSGNEQDQQQQGRTPLQQVQEQQAIKQEDHEVREQRADADTDVPGQSSPSNIRKHPQRRTG